MSRRKVMVRWGEAVTPLGSRVRVGIVEEIDGVYLEFTPVKGKGNCRKKTKLHLSRPAMEAVAKLWNSWLDFEAKKNQWTYVTKMLVRRILPTVPWAWAGIPPISEPNAVKESTMVFEHRPAEGKRTVASE